MTVYIASFVALLLACAGLGVGVLAGRGAIRGSCGGLANCSCERPCPRRRSMIARLERDRGD